MNNTALVLIDFQNEWVDVQSEYYVGDISNVIDKVNRLIDCAIKSNWKVIVTQHVEKESAKEFAPNSKSIQIISKIKVHQTDTIVTKYKISPFYKTSMKIELKGINKVVVCGILTNLCVRSFVQDAYDRDFDITIVKDCCVAFDKKTHNFTLKDLKETREEIKVISSKEILK